MSKCEAIVKSLFPCYDKSLISHLNVEKLDFLIIVVINHVVFCIFANRNPKCSKEYLEGKPNASYNKGVRKWISIGYGRRY